MAKLDVNKAPIGSGTLGPRARIKNLSLGNVAPKKESVKKIVKREVTPKKKQNRNNPHNPKLVQGAANRLPKSEQAGDADENWATLEELIAEINSANDLVEQYTIQEYDDIRPEEGTYKVFEAGD